MAMMTINASPGDEEPDGEPRAQTVSDSPGSDGLTRSILSELLRERDDRKRLRNQYPFGSRHVLYDLQQNVLKVIMNSYYGSRATPVQALRP